MIFAIGSFSMVAYPCTSTAAVKEPSGTRALLRVKTCPAGIDLKPMSWLNKLGLEESAELEPVSCMPI